jgi:Ca-activated chloride channel family protein
VALPPTSGAQRQKIMTALNDLESGGSTHGSAGILQAYALARRNFRKDGINRVVLATDGDFNVGVTGKDQLTSLIEKKRETGVYLTVLGVGRGNLADARMEALADRGNGTYAYLDSLDEARRVLVEEAAETFVTVATDAKVQVEFNPRRVGSYRLVGYENRVLADAAFDDDRKDAGDMGAGHTVTALYEIEPTTGGKAGEDGLRYQKPQLTGAADSGELALVKVRYKDEVGARSRKIEVPIFDPGHPLADASQDLRFQVAVAAFGLKLRGSKRVKNLSLEAIEDLARRGAGDEADRRELVQLIRTARRLKDQA